VFVVVSVLVFDFNFFASCPQTALLVGWLTTNNNVDNIGLLHVPGYILTLAHIANTGGKGHSV
jgi:hypothetical protein